MPNRAQSFLLPALVHYDQPHWDGELAADIFAADGTPALAVFDGTAYPKNFSLGGFTNRIVADDGTEAYFGHLRDAGRVSGRVKAGDVIGYVSNSGNARHTSPHIHFAVGAINSNGGGTIDVRTFFSGAQPLKGADQAPSQPAPSQPAPTPPVAPPMGNFSIPPWAIALGVFALLLDLVEDL